MRDFFSECYEADAKMRDLGAPKEFEEVFCARCRQAGCVRAGWSKDRFGQRVSTQVERVLLASKADPTLPKFAKFAEQDFKDMLGQAMALEIAERKGDWEIPEIPILDGKEQVAGTKTTSAVDEAIRGLAGSKGKDAPDLPDPGQAEFAQETADMMGLAMQVDEPIEEPVEHPAEEIPPPHPPNPPNPEPRPPAEMPRTQVRGNTEVPSDGIMVGGGKTPAPPEPKPDPWAVTNQEQKAEVGARIRMGLAGPPDKEKDEK